MKLTIRHTLTFSLGTPARAVQHLLLTPSATPQQKIERWSIEMAGLSEAAVFRDAYGNRAHLVSQVKPDAAINVVVSGRAETFDKAGVLGRLEYDPVPALFRRSTNATKPDPAIIDGLKDGPDRIALFHEVMRRVSEAFSGPSQTQQQNAAEPSRLQSQGEAAGPPAFAEAFVGAVRGLDIPARYVTGYLLDDDNAASFHAWAEAWDERLGWIGFDPALNLCPAENHLRVASGLDAMGTLPIRPAPAWLEMPAETVTIDAD